MAEDLSAGELQEKLKRLESLQELRVCNEDKLTTIERSAESEEVKKALQKNPDISKERSNLLQGGGTHLTHIHTPSPMRLLPTILATPTPHTHALTTSHFTRTHYPHSLHPYTYTTSHSSHIHTHTTSHSSHPHRLVSCHICAEGQDRGDEEESQDGAGPGGGPAH